MPFESLYLTSYLSSIDISTPNHTVLKIFDFKGLTLTINFQKSSEVKIFLPFESPYITPYLTSFDFKSGTVLGFELDL